MISWCSMHLTLGAIMGEAASVSVLLLACAVAELLASAVLTVSLVCCNLRLATALAPSPELTTDGQ